MKFNILFLLLFMSGFLLANTRNAAPVLTSGSTNPSLVVGQNYPNPAKGKTVILVEFSSNEAILIVYNVLGKLVEQRVISADQKRITLDVSEYKEGIYLYSIEADGKKITKRMTVSK